MNWKRIKVYAIFIAATEAVGALSGWLTNSGMKYYSETVQKPPLSPPSIVFPIVWAILYALMAFAAARIWMSPPSEDRTSGIKLYIAQLVLNFFWSIIFFDLRLYATAFVWLAAMWALILLMILKFRKIDRLAAYINIPYLVWVLFAGYLNVGVWILN